MSRRGDWGRALPRVPRDAHRQPPTPPPLELPVNFAPILVTFDSSSCSSDSDWQMPLREPRRRRRSPSATPKPPHYPRSDIANQSSPLPSTPRRSSLSSSRTLSPKRSAGSVSLMSADRVSHEVRPTSISWGPSSISHVDTDAPASCVMPQSRCAQVGMSLSEYAKKELPDLDMIFRGLFPSSSRNTQNSPPLRTSPRGSPKLSQAPSSPRRKRSPGCGPDDSLPPRPPAHPPLPSHSIASASSTISSDASLNSFFSDGCENSSIAANSSLQSVPVTRARHGGTAEHISAGNATFPSYSEMKPSYSRSGRLSLPSPLSTHCRHVGNERDGAIASWAKSPLDGKFSPMSPLSPLPQSARWCESSAPSQQQRMASWRGTRLPSPNSGRLKRRLSGGLGSGRGYPYGSRSLRPVANTARVGEPLSESLLLQGVSRLCRSVFAMLC